MKHTPGPWTLSERSERDGVDIDVVTDKRRIAQSVAVAPRLYGETEGMANARLIAAAPELLEFVKKMRADTLCICKLNGAFGTSVECTHCIAGAVIAKAEGV